MMTCGDGHTLATRGGGGSCWRRCGHLMRASDGLLEAFPLHALLGLGDGHGARQRHLLRELGWLAVEVVVLRRVLGSVLKVGAGTTYCDQYYGMVVAWRRGTPATLSARPPPPP
jgi:hypothetical protein